MILYSLFPKKLQYNLKVRGLSNVIFLKKVFYVSNIYLTKYIAKQCNTITIKINYFLF